MSRLPVLVLAATLAFPALPARGLEGGIFDCAREGDPAHPCLPAGLDTGGCGASGCHGGLLPENTTTLLLLEGLPEDGWAAGETYDLTISVYGPHVPVPDGCPGVVFFPALTNTAGFNLEITGGTLAAIGTDPGIRFQHDTECGRFRRLTGCDGPSAPPCPSGCDDQTIVNTQATHSVLGNSQRTWRARWTPPAAGSGAVTVYLAGNSVNGNCRPDAGDLYTVSPPRVVPERE